MYLAYQYIEKRTDGCLYLAGTQNLFILCDFPKIHFYGNLFFAKLRFHFLKDLQAHQQEILMLRLCFPLGKRRLI